MSQPLLAAVVQLTATRDVAANLQAAERLVAEAASRGARWIALPEMWPYIGDLSAPEAPVEDLSGPTVAAMRRWARTHGVVLFGGSVPERAPGQDRCFNTSMVFDPAGELLASYRKIHLFDIDLPGGPRLKESDSYAPGEEAVVLSVDSVGVGLSICYDLRFPALYQALRDAGSEVVLVPAAFTAETGKAHWEVLLRARAIEQQQYVLAANQWGPHSAGRRSHGQSMIVDPWGVVLAQVPDGEGVAVAALELDRVARVRRQLPCGAHRRPFRTPSDA